MLESKYYDQIAQVLPFLRNTNGEIARGRIHALRKALEPDLRHPEYVITVRDVGYNLVT